MKRFFLTLLTLVLASVACMQPIPTSTPNALGTSPTTALATLAPQPTATLTATPPPTADAQTAVIKAATVNVRQSPNGEVVGQLLAGQSVTIITCADSWCQIEEPAGYVFEGCLSISDGKGCEAK